MSVEAVVPDSASDQIAEGHKQAAIDRALDSLDSFTGTTVVPAEHESTVPENGTGLAVWPDSHEELESVLRDLQLAEPFATKDIRPIFGMREEWGISEVGVVVPPDATVQEVYDLAGGIGKGGNFVPFASGDIGQWLLEEKGLSIETIAGMFGVEVKTMQERIRTIKRIPLSDRILYSGWSASSSPVTYEHHVIAAQSYIDAEKAEGERAGLPDLTVLRHSLARLRNYKDRKVKDVNGVVQKVPDTREWRIEVQRYSKAYKAVSEKESLQFLLDEKGNVREVSGRSLSARNSVVSALFGVMDYGSVTQTVAKNLTSDQLQVIQTEVSEVFGKNPTSAERKKLLEVKRLAEKEKKDTAQLPDGTGVAKELAAQEPTPAHGKSLVIQTASAEELLDQNGGDVRKAEVQAGLIIANVMEYLLNRRSMTPEQFSKKGITTKFIDRINLIEKDWIHAK